MNVIATPVNAIDYDRFADFSVGLPFPVAQRIQSPATHSTVLKVADFRDGPGGPQRCLVEVDARKFSIPSICFIVARASFRDTNGVTPSLIFWSSPRNRQCSRMSERAV
jgi:hypothetical protein